ncbi:argonaute/piwi family protein [Bradyrhizobium sp. HKCCYLS20291]|uniref:argonaute/piwi family protein n=1 Tax=Bradyrhizobium sp. HKCCYLS20291 TaxID=3420766 RepID=UPI003EBD593D
MKLTTLPEPLLEFGTGTHVCPRTGIEHLGVYDKRDDLRRTELRIGVVGRGEGIDLLDDWLERCRDGIERKEGSKLLNLFRGFGGINQDYGFLTRIINSPQYTRTIKKSDISAVVKLTSRVERVEKAVALYYEQIRFLAENRSVDVIVCVMPNEMFDSVTTTAESDDGDSGESELEHNFRRILKAKSMHLGTPLQLVREKTILITKQAGDQQDPATKAWNFVTALYYKGNKTIPWRLVEDTAKLRSCYIGIGFYKSRDGETVSSSLAQVFDEFGHGIILRGTPVSIDKKDRRPYLSEDQAYDLLRDALDEYGRALGHMPARIVIHKSSQFRDSERKGLVRAIKEKGIRAKDFVAITDTDIRLFGDGDYPPKRGTLMTISESEGVLYTRGTVDFYKTYPGMYVPAPLKVTVYEQDSSLESLCEEILGLTKMNWNNTQMDGRLPITLECARKIGDIMKYVSPTEKPQVSYSFYM